MTGRMTTDCADVFDGLPAPVESSQDIFEQAVALSSVDGSQRGGNRQKKPYAQNKGKLLGGFID